MPAVDGLDRTILCLCHFLLTCLAALIWLGLDLLCARLLAVAFVTRLLPGTPCLDTVNNLGRVALLVLLACARAGLAIARRLLGDLDILAIGITFYLLPLPDTRMSVSSPTVLVQSSIGTKLASYTIAHQFVAASVDPKAVLAEKHKNTG